MIVIFICWPKRYFIGGLSRLSEVEVILIAFQEVLNGVIELPIAVRRMWKLPFLSGCLDPATEMATASTARDASVSDVQTLMSHLVETAYLEMCFLTALLEAAM